MLDSQMQVFRDLDFTLLEMNPFTLDSAGLPFPLDMRGELDDTAAFKSGKKWGPVEFPLPFGRSMTSAEERILAMDENTGAQAAAQCLGCIDMLPFYLLTSRTQTGPRRRTLTACGRLSSFAQPSAHKLVGSCAWHRSEHTKHRGCSSAW